MFLLKYADFRLRFPVVREGDYFCKGTPKPVSTFDYTYALGEPLPTKLFFLTLSGDPATVPMVRLDAANRFAFFGLDSFKSR